MKAITPVHPDPNHLEGADGGITEHRHTTDVESLVALEAALQVADNVLAAGIGDQRVRDSVRSALRMGADVGIHIEFEPAGTILAEKYAAVFARLANRKEVDAVFIPERFPFFGEEVTGLVGSELDWPSLTQVTGIGDEMVSEEFETVDGEVLVQRKMDIGIQEIVGIRLPAVFGISGGFDNPRRAALDEALTGTQRGIESQDLRDIAPNESPFSMCVGNRTLRDISVHGRWGTGSPPKSQQVEARILELLGREEGEEMTEGELIDEPPAIAAKMVVERLQEEEML